MREIKNISRNIVNQLFDLAEVSVDKRQEINDVCDDFVYKLINDSFKRKEELYVLAIQNLRKHIAWNNLYGCVLHPNDEEIDRELAENPDKFIINLNRIPTEEDIELIKDIMLKVGYDEDTSISDVGEMFSIDTILKNPFKI